MDTDDSSWIFDSLVCFLNGPVWTAPLKSFIEEKSLIFELSNDQNNLEYKIVFEEFQNLVDLMLGTYMEDIGITPEQFETACSKQYTSELPVQFHKNLFEQIWAANDYNVFVRMMCQKNIELQLQALELIKTKHGLTFDNLFKSEALINTTTADTNEIDDAENTFILNEIKKQVAAEQRESQPNINDEELNQISTDFEKNLQIELNIKKQELDSALESAIAESASNYTTEKPPSPIESEEANNEPTTPPQTTTAVPLPDNTIKFKKIDELELKKRQEYLKAQRDKLVALKKQAREKQLKTSLDGETSKEKRPKSAKVAEAVLATSVGSKIDTQSLQIRRALAERLRTEVVSHKD
ncbi:cilia- and flagella-associated protein 36 [Chrysoperla carnea]|uniref:cilia- and flagella-associated protein 36 n=1 Tax=Chrysoperla carnea TaxID=189513 RepID=UPI001D077C77|nr:cilia- and flagella-associated protein 36 [Chrysoperla carnea]